MAERAAWGLGPTSDTRSLTVYTAINPDKDPDVKLLTLTSPPPPSSDGIRLQMGGM